MRLLKIMSDLPINSFAGEKLCITNKECGNLEVLGRKV